MEIGALCVPLRTLVLELLGLGSPPAVLRRVRTIIVYTFERQAGRRMPHVGKEVFVNTPASANDNPPATVVPEVAGVGVVASLDHPAPALIGWTAGETMCLEPFTRLFAAETSAGFGVAGGQIPYTGCGDRATVTAQLPDMMLAIDRTEGSYSDQSAEAAVGKVQRMSHV